MTDQMTWDIDSSRGFKSGVQAEVIVAWIESLGGKARYEGDTIAVNYRLPPGPCIVITGPDGPIYVYHGDTVHDTGEWFVTGRCWACDLRDGDEHDRLRLFRTSAAAASEEKR